MRCPTQPIPPAGYRLQARDTAYAVERMLIDWWRGMSVVEKAAQVGASFRAVEELAAAGVRLRYPHADAREVWLRTVALRLGPELTAEVYGWRPRADQA